MSREKIHNQMLENLNEINAEDSEYFKPSAMNYAEQKKPEVFSLLNDHQSKLNDGASHLKQNRYSPSFDYKSHLFFQPSNSAVPLNNQQNQKLRKNAKNTEDRSKTKLVNRTNFHSLAAQEAKKDYDKFNVDLVNLVSKIGVQGPSKTAKPLKEIWEELDLIIDKDPSFAVFLNFCSVQMYEAAIRSLISLKNQQKAAKLAEQLFQYKEQLGLNLNEMIDGAKQNPIHQAAIELNEELYCALGGPVCGGNIFSRDCYGNTAYDYWGAGKCNFMTSERPKTF